MTLKKDLFFYLFLYFVSLWVPIQGITYIYPVLEIENHIYVLLQEHENTNLLEWDPESKNLSPVLAPWYNPTHIVLLPHKQAFSFIDQDTINIKFFNQRSASRIPLKEPLYNFSVIQWVDDTHFCCSAMKNGRFSIFEISCEGDVIEKIADPLIDCVYPQKVGENLYYIARSSHNNTYSYSIRRSVYAYDFHRPEQDELCIDCGGMSIAFLSLNPVEGNWVISYVIDGDTKKEWVDFCYYEIFFNEGLKERFSFKVAKKYLFDSLYRLNESLLPVLPRTCGNTVYFVSSDGLCRWDRIKNKVKIVTSYKSLCTVPLYSGIYGGSLSYDLFPYIQYDSLKNISNIVKINFPHLN